MGNTGGGAGFQEDEEFHSWSVSGRVAYLLDEQLKIRCEGQFGYWVGA